MTWPTVYKKPVRASDTAHGNVYGGWEVSLASVTYLRPEVDQHRFRDSASGRADAAQALDYGAVRRKGQCLYAAQVSQRTRTPIALSS